MKQKGAGEWKKNEKEDKRKRTGIRVVLAAGLLAFGLLCTSMSGCGRNNGRSRLNNEKFLSAQTPEVSTEKAVNDMESAGTYAYEQRNYIYNTGDRSLKYSGQKFFGEKNGRRQKLKTITIWDTYIEPEAGKEPKKDAFAPFSVYFREKLSGLDIYTLISENRSGESRWGWRDYSKLREGTETERTVHELNCRCFSIEEEVNGKIAGRFEGKLPCSAVFKRYGREEQEHEGEYASEYLPVTMWFDKETGQLIKFLYENTVLRKHRLREDSRSFTAVIVSEEPEEFELPE